jgi:hypothetical protein
VRWRQGWHFDRASGGAAGPIVTIAVDETTLRVYGHRDHLIKHAPRTSRKEVRRHKAYGHTANRKTG